MMRLSREKMDRVGVGSLLLICFLVKAVSALVDRPNIILHLIDDASSKEFGFMGNTNIRTGNINRMARQGVWFQKAFSMPICRPTRSSMLTGKLPFETGWWDQNEAPRGEAGNLGVRFGTFATEARKAGYLTLVAGKWQLNGLTWEYGFDEYCTWDHDDIEGRYKLRDKFGGGVDPITGKSVRYWYPLIVENNKSIPTGPTDFGPDIILNCMTSFIRKAKRLNKKFLIYHASLLTHQDYDPSNPAATSAGLAYTTVPKSNALGMERVGSLKSNIEYLDKLTGKLQKFLRQQKLSRKTAVIVTADNGTAGYGKGLGKSQRSIHVPLIAWGPGVFPRRGSSTRLVSTIDLYQTIVDLTGAQEQRRDSYSIAGYLKGEDTVPERQWVWAYLGSGKPGARDGRWIRTSSYVLDPFDTLYRCSTGYHAIEDKCKARPKSDPMYRKLERLRGRIEKGWYLNATLPFWNSPVDA